MSSPWSDSIAKAVSDGKTQSQFAVPDAQYIGDLFFITDSKHQIIVGLMWAGERWITEFDTFYVQQPTKEIPK